MQISEDLLFFPFVVEPDYIPEAIRNMTKEQLDKRLGVVSRAPASRAMSAQEAACRQAAADAQASVDLSKEYPLPKRRPRHEPE